MPLLLFSFLLIVPASAAITPSQNTYAIIHTDEGRFSEVITVNNSVYILFDTSIYAYNISTAEFQRKFDIGLNYIGVDFAYDNGSFYIAGYQVKRHIYNSSSGGGGNVPVITCPIPTDVDFDIFNFTVWQTNSQFGIIKEITLSKELYGKYYSTAINSMFVAFGKELVVAITGYSESDLSTPESYVYIVDFSTGAFIQKLNFTERITDLAYYNSSYYINLGGTKINVYDSQLNFVKSYEDTVYGMHIVNMDFDNGYAYLVGHGTDSHGNHGAIYEVLTADLSTNVYYLFFNDTQQFNAVKHFLNRTYVVGNNNILYVFDDATNHIIAEYSNDMNYAYNLHDKYYYKVDNAPVPLKVVAFRNKTGAVKVMWGGYYVGDDNFIYAYLISTDKPANWDPWAGGSWVIPPELQDLWQKYKLYFLLGGGIFLLLLLSGGSRR